MNHTESHIFSIFVTHLAQIQAIGQITDESMVHRLVKVMRLSAGQSVVLFDALAHTMFTITQVDRKKVVGTCGPLQNNVHLSPTISLLLPLLKREALEEAVYGAVEVGVNSIQLVITAKTQRDWTGKRDYERLMRKVIAAAEQSKQYAGVSIDQPLSLTQALERFKELPLLFAHPTGKSLINIPKTDCALIIGPEGDLTSDERAQVMQAGAFCFKLTPTVLRAQQAAVIAAALLRTF